MTADALLDGGRLATDPKAVARGLGWFSLGLGLAELVAPRTLARTLGVEGREGLIRAFGAREVATGIGILCARDPQPYVWGRVAGDAADLGALALALGPDNRQRGNVVAAMVAVAGVTAVDILCADALRQQPRKPAAPPRDYSSRSGFPRAAAEMRGAAREARAAPGRR